MFYTRTNVKEINSKMKKVEDSIGQRVFYAPNDCTFWINVDGHIKCIGAMSMTVEGIAHEAELILARRS